jgi:hypothetical protein
MIADQMPEGTQQGNHHPPDQQPHHLPAGWEERRASALGGRHYFVYVEDQPRSTWLDPRRPINDDDPLPVGWEGRVDRSFRWFYLNKHTKTITYEDPRLPRCSPAERLLRGQILSDMWFYGQVPPPASIASGGAQGTRAPEPSITSTTSPAVQPPSYTGNNIHASCSAVPNGGGE